MDKIQSTSNSHLGEDPGILGKRILSSQNFYGRPFDNVPSQLVMYSFICFRYSCIICHFSRSQSILFNVLISLVPRMWTNVRFGRACVTTAPPVRIQWAGSPVFASTAGQARTARSTLTTVQAQPVSTERPALTAWAVSTASARRERQVSDVLSKACVVSDTSGTMCY